MGWKDSAAGDIYQGFMDKTKSFRQGAGDFFGSQFRQVGPHETLMDTLRSSFNPGAATPKMPKPGPFPGSFQSGVLEGLPIKEGPQFRPSAQVGAQATPKSPQPVGVSGSPGFEVSQQAPYMQQEESNPQIAKTGGGLFQLGVGMQDPGHFMFGEPKVTPLGEQRRSSSSGGARRSVSSEGSLGAVEKAGLMRAQAENESAQAGILSNPTQVDARFEAEQRMAPGSMQKHRAMLAMLAENQWASGVKPGDVGGLLQRAIQAGKQAHDPVIGQFLNAWGPAEGLDISAPGAREVLQYHNPRAGF